MYMQVSMDRLSSDTVLHELHAGFAVYVTLYTNNYVCII